jgi:hypothetical protein
MGFFLCGPEGVPLPAGSRGEGYLIREKFFDQKSQVSVLFLMLKQNNYTNRF